MLQLTINTDVKLTSYLYGKPILLYNNKNLNNFTNTYKISSASTVLSAFIVSCYA